MKVTAKRPAIFGVVFALCVVVDTSLAQGVPTVRFHNARCADYFFPLDAVDVSGEPIKKKPRDAYCTQDDLSANRPHVVAKLLNERKQSEHAISVAVTSFTITNEAFIDAICKKIGGETKSVAVYSQNELPAYGTEKIKQCAEVAGVVDVQSGLRGREGDFSSFHPKIVALDFKDGFTDLYLSSGNPTTGSELYFDHNVVLSAPTASPFVNWHKCIASLFKEGAYSPSYRAMRQRYRTCERKAPHLVDPQVSAYLLPFDRESFVTQFAFYAGRSSAIRIMVQSANAVLYRDLLIGAMEHGVSVRVIRDDDLYWAGTQDDGHSDFEFFNQRNEYLKWMKPLIERGAQVRYVQTNHHAPGKNFVHTKFVVFDLIGGGQAIYFGSANLTNAALYRNFENVYFSEAKELAGKFSIQFDKYWNELATPIANMPAKDQIPSRSAADLRFSR